MLSDDQIRKLEPWFRRMGYINSADTVRELLVARKVVRAAREYVSAFYPMTDEYRPLWLALNKYDEATRLGG